MDSLAERQSAPTGAQEPASEQQADRPLGDAACWLSSVMGRIAEGLDPIMRREGVGSVRVEGRKLCIKLAEQTFILAWLPDSQLPDFQPGVIQHGGSGPQFVRDTEQPVRECEIEAMYGGMLRQP